MWERGSRPLGGVLSYPTAPPLGSGRRQVRFSFPIPVSSVPYSHDNHAVNLVFTLTLSLLLCLMSSHQPCDLRVR